MEMDNKAILDVNCSKNEELTIKLKLLIEYKMNDVIKVYAILAEYKHFFI